MVAEGTSEACVPPSQAHATTRSLLVLDCAAPSTAPTAVKAVAEAEAEALAVTVVVVALETLKVGTTGAPPFPTHTVVGGWISSPSAAATDATDAAEQQEWLQGLAATDGTIR